MNPIAQEAIGSILRWGLAIVAGYLVKQGIWTDAAATTYVMAASLALLSVGWSLWQKYHDRVKLLTALTMPAGTTENQVIAKVASGAVTPTVTTPPDSVPGVPK